MELIYPESQDFQFNISNSQRAFLRSMLTISPHQSSIQQIANQKDFHINYTNYLFFGQESKPRDTQVELTNIVGLAYGFMTDICFARDPASDTEFFLSATLYLNSSNTFGNGLYEYETIGFPFMKSLGREVMNLLRGN